MYFKQFFDEKLAQYAYLIGCQATGEALIIDPIRVIDQYIDVAANEKLTIIAAADTHIHADYLSGLREFAERGIKVLASDEGDHEWKYEWLKNNTYDYKLLHNEDTFKIGNITIKAWHTPGHTPEHLSFLITDSAAAKEPVGIITGDFIFVGDVGRPDLLESAAGQAGAMKPSAQTLYKSVEAFKTLPEYLQVWPGHGAGSACGKTLGAIPGSTVGYELRYNNSIKAGDTEENFVDFILDGQPEPPFYFARMKHENKTGPDLINGLPKPERLTLTELGKLSDNENVTVIDTRTREEFSEAHLPGSLLSPLDKQFNTVAGCYTTGDERIYLIVDKKRLHEAVVDLIHIGLDHIEGFATPADLEALIESGGKSEKMNVGDFNMAEAFKENDKYQVLDVRKASEFKVSHIPDAINIAHTRLFDRIDEVPRDKHLLVHCETGIRSAVASAFLQSRGFTVTLIDDEFKNYPKNLLV